MDINLRINIIKELELKQIKKLEEILVNMGNIFRIER